MKEQGTEDFGTTTEKQSETLGDYSYTNGSSGSGSGGSAEDSAILSPIAQRWITKLRWKRTRTMDPMTPTERILIGDGDFDGLFPWFPRGDLGCAWDSEGRRVGKECVGTFRSGGSRYY